MGVTYHPPSGIATEGSLVVMSRSETGALHCPAVTTADSSIADGLDAVLPQAMSAISEASPARFIIVAS